MNLERMLTEREVASLLGVSHRTVQDWRRRGVGPPFWKMGRSVRYATSDLQQWLETQQKENGNAESE